ncbi:unnamed protein product, partial [Amoebophrya sp. A120]
PGARFFCSLRPSPLGALHSGPLSAGMRAVAARVPIRSSLAPVLVPLWHSSFCGITDLEAPGALSAGLKVASFGWRRPVLAWRWPCRSLDRSVGQGAACPGTVILRTAGRVLSETKSACRNDIQPVAV